MKRGFLLLALSLCVVVATSCGPSPDATSTQTPTVVTATPVPSPQPSDTPSPTATDSERPERHYEPSGGFSYIPPAGWQLVEASGVEYKAALGPVKDDFAPNIIVVSERFSGSLEEYVSSSLDNMSQFFEGFQVISQDDFEPEEGPTGVRIVVENVQGGRAMHQVFHIFDVGATKLVVTCTRLAGPAQELDAMCEGSVKTLRIESE